MSLYYEAASFLSESDQQRGSLKSRVYAARNLKSTPAQLFALLTEAAKWSHILKGVIENAGLLEQERKITPPLALLLVHDLLLARRGIAAPANHPLRLAIARHKNRIGAVFTKARLKRKCANVHVLRELVEETAGRNFPSSTQTAVLAGSVQQESLSGPRPRWIRINTLKTTLEQQLASTFAEYQKVESLEDLRQPGGRAALKYYLDAHVPSVMAVAGDANLTGLSAYQQGLLILQDKASCFPAYLLNAQPEEGDLLDACAAPGNKTTHLAALAASSGSRASGKIWACERDALRAETLRKMVTLAGATSVTVQAPQDFLDLDPNLEPWSRIGALLLDPSCSGSGMMERDDGWSFVLPVKQAQREAARASRKKRKRRPAPATEPVSTEEPLEETSLPESTDAEAWKSRLVALSSFQLKVLLHAFTFPAARRIVYSTCSISEDENEGVVARALTSPLAKQQRWKMLKREDQVAGMKAWELRGHVDAFGAMDDALEVAEACLRCERDGVYGTQGFFTAAFVRDDEPGDHVEEAEEEEEWQGFGDGAHE